MTTTADAGSGSLRDAIIQANAHLGRDVIAFNGVTWPMDITLASPLPVVTDGVVMIASWGSVYPAVSLRGEAVDGPGLVIEGDSTAIVGLGVFGFRGDGIVVRADDVGLDEMYVGTDHLGSAGLGNGGSGIVVDDGADRTILGSNGAPNRIGANGGWGVVVRGTDTLVSKNTIGDPVLHAGAGPSVLGNAAGGVWVDGAVRAAIGRDTLGPRIAGNRGPGVRVDNSASFTTLQAIDIADNAGDGLLITGGARNTALRPAYATIPTIVSNHGNGVTIQGSSVADTQITAAIGGHRSGNRGYGVLIDGAVRTRVGSDPTYPHAAGTVAGNGRDGILADTALDTTVVDASIVRNGGAGIRVRNSTRTTIGEEADFFATAAYENDGSGVAIEPGATETRIDGAFIGVSLSPFIGKGNVGDGITVTGASGTTISNSVILGNGGYGVRVSSAAPLPRTQIIGNTIGVFARGTSPRPEVGNRRGGILIDRSVADIGDRQTIANGNEIIRNGGPGITLNAAAGTLIANNSIDHNGGLAIDHLSSAPPVPVLTGTTGTSSTTSVSGVLQGRSNTAYTISAAWSPACDPSGTGEAAMPWASAAVVTDPSGHAAFNVEGAAVTAGASIAATATAANETASELSNCVVVGPFDGRAADVLVAEGETTVGDVATFTDRDGDTDPGRYEATISWGDGSPTTAVTVVSRPNGRLAVVASHTWRYELSTSLTVTVREPEESQSASFVGDVRVEHGPETARGRDTDSDQVTTDGVVVASYADGVGGCCWRSSVDWGYPRFSSSTESRTTTSGETEILIRPPQLEPGSYTLEVLLDTGHHVEHSRSYVAHSTYLVRGPDSPAASFIQFDALGFRAAEDSGGATVTLVRTGNLDVPASVRYSATLDTASSTDATPITGTANFAPGQRRATFTVSILDDQVGGETTEGVQLSLSEPVGAGLGTTSTALLSIIEDPDDLVVVPAPQPPSTTTTTTTTTTTLASAPTTTAPPAPPDPARRGGYVMLDAGGATYAFGDVAWRGNAPVGEARAADVELSPSRNGYWVTDAVGHVFTFGDARYFGGTPRLESDETVTSLSATPTGDGYWLFTTRGRVIPFGHAPYLGDMRGTQLNGPVLDSVPTPSGRGYYMVASDGGIFTFGDARFTGSMGDARLNAPVQSLVPDSDGVGYWLVASDGGIFAFDAPFYGSMGSVRLNRPVTAMVGDDRGYLMVAEDGGIFTFGDAAFYGSLGDRPPARSVVGVAAG